MLEHKSYGTWCKICGITTPADASAAQSAGADAIGINCYPDSPRYVGPRQVAQIAHSVQISRVALFVNADADEVQRVLSIAEIDVLQFHGDEDEPFCASFGLPYIKALRMADGVNARTYVERYESAWAVMLDAYHPQLAGGTGEQFDWQRWPDITDRRLILAGGLTPDNVAGAIARLHPFGVDVAGGVEGPHKGCKDDHKVSRFVRACKEKVGQ